MDDQLWARIEALLPPPKPRRFKYPGRKPVPDREALTGIIYVLKTGIRWGDLPADMGCGSGVSCWRRLRDWQQSGIWEEMQAILMNEIGVDEKIDFSRAAKCTGTVRGPRLKEGPPRSQSGGESSGTQITHYPRQVQS
ncbi:transposase [Burkholderia lata]|uniref:Transposase n=1 Tax=Burkholderia lata (strain ATCC 17760 / DSM 23089 / LMG 22485 / NCIMB 9086 / R18194 / 383) TaxID=482957 RepID=A0A6P2UFU0_BURL3|nr:transposase [Burkholderia lata]